MKIAVWRSSPLTVLAAIGLLGGPASAQTFPSPDPVLESIWVEGMDRSEAWELGQALLDSIGPRLTGTPAADRANEWAMAVLSRWGVDARVEVYGTWKGWERGITHLDLLSPRVRTLEATLMAWSPGTDGTVSGGVVRLPAVTAPAEFEAWLPEVEGRFVALARPEPSCRPEGSFASYGTEEQLEAVSASRAEAAEEWSRRVAAIGLTPAEILEALEGAGALGVLWSDWSGGWGARAIFSLHTRFGAATSEIPAVDLSCEDYGLVWRLSERGQGPRLRLTAESRVRGEVPVGNVIGTIRGVELPDEYVILSAHFDSWDGASGATDNGTGTIVMLEAMRILAAVYPDPRRTIVVGLWGSEEQGLNGSRAFARDHPEVIDGLQAVFNQDNGTGRISRAGSLGLVRSGGNLAGWLSRIPPEITRFIQLSVPGVPTSGGTDHASFICSGAPAFSLWSSSWDYFPYTWHTNLDTFDKIVWENVRSNATLYAMLAYLAAEDERVPRDRRVMPVDAISGEPQEWPACEDGSRQTSERYE